LTRQKKDEEKKVKEKEVKEDGENEGKQSSVCNAVREKKKTDS